MKLGTNIPQQMHQDAGPVSNASFSGLQRVILPRTSSVLSTRIETPIGRSKSITRASPGTGDIHAVYCRVLGYSKNDIILI